MIIALIPLLATGEATTGYTVHDRTRPQPQKVTPGALNTQNRPATAPSDDTALFDGKDLSQWQSTTGDPAPWKLADGFFEVTPHTGNIHSKPEFGDCQVHVEWREPPGITGEGQGLYEIPVLDSSGTQTYPDGMAGAIYGQYPPSSTLPARPASETPTTPSFTPPKSMRPATSRPPRA